MSDHFTTLRSKGLNEWSLSVLAKDFYHKCLIGSKIQPWTALPWFPVMWYYWFLIWKYPVLGSKKKRSIRKLVKFIDTENQLYMRQSFYSCLSFCFPATEVVIMSQLQSSLNSIKIYRIRIFQTLKHRNNRNTKTRWEGAK